MYKNKVILVTGSSKGIGLEIAQYFLSRDSVVIGLSRSIPATQHENYHHFSVDLGDPKAIADCFGKKIKPQFKKLDMVINNAAVLTSQYSMIMPVENAVDMVNVNLLGVFMVSREASKLMRNDEPGRMINISSMAVSLEPKGDALYAATKAGINSLANSMAKEFSSYNVTCNTLAVTAFESDMLRQHSEDAQLTIKSIIDDLPIPRIAEIDDILNVIDFFASDKSSYITAQTIYLGGVN